MLAAALVLTPMVAALLVAGLTAWRRRDPWTAVADLVVAAVVLGCGTGLVLVVRQGGPVRLAGGLLRVDALSSYLLVVVGLVALTSLGGGLADATERASTDGRLTALVSLFLAAMTLALVADNLGLLWVAVEATTITTAFLVGYHQTRQAVEAAWKYVVLGSAGLAIAFLGLVLLYAAGESGTRTLSWVTLMQQASRLDPHLLRLAVALAVFGLASKAGLAPLHSWLPDAHSQAPAPVSGLMSGVLLSVAFYGILRVQALATAAGQGGLVRALLLVAGLLSLLVAGLLTLTQRDLKRLLAYSSIEHMGIIALAAAAGGRLGTAVLLLHMLGHGLAKAVVFATSGRIAQDAGSTRLTDVHALLSRRPDLAGPFLAGTAALLGFPPFVLTLTEIGLVLALVQAGLAWAALAALALLLLSFTGICRHALSLSLGAGPTPGGRPGTRPGAGSRRSLDSRRTSGPRVAWPLVTALVLCAALTLGAWPLRDLLVAAADSLTSIGATR